MALASCTEGELGCYVQKFYLRNESRSNVRALLFERNNGISLIKEFNLGNDEEILFHETDGGGCFQLEDNFIGDSLVFVFDNNKKIIFECPPEESNFVGTGRNICSVKPETLSIDRYALNSQVYMSIGESEDLYYTITRLDYALAE